MERERDKWGLELTFGALGRMIGQRFALEMIAAHRTDHKKGIKFVCDHSRWRCKAGHNFTTVWTCPV